mmetsp:Transcript_7247/g.3953  ORF Transcript_7247/g.3953 Transcript_7247/m.3953 type:complete len:99 (+) Transcript_7247:502-798(+)
MPDEINKVINGEGNITVTFLKSHCKSEGEKEVAWVWKWLEESEYHVLKAFLKFTTGSSFIPLHARGYRINISRGGLGLLPMAGTCGNSICIPCYESYE